MNINELTPKGVLRLRFCLLDLDYNLPVQVRDYALGLDNEDEPSSGVGKEYQLQRKVDEGSLDSSFAQQRPTDLLLKMQRSTPYYKVRNRKGERVSSKRALGTHC